MIEAQYAAQQLRLLQERQTSSGLVLRTTTLITHFPVAVALERLLPMGSLLMDAQVGGLSPTCRAKDFTGSACFELGFLSRHSFALLLKDSQKSP